MTSGIHNEDLERARQELRSAMSTTRWLRRTAVLLALATAVLVLAIRLQG